MFSIELATFGINQNCFAANIVTVTMYGIMKKKIENNEEQKKYIYIYI